ncbi:uncharacterized protein EV420DRAFT_1641151 [Desarmillaria tabescens]|uniref:F-box domain-containing protein n=1 Tax=Armillaria tabescens TaxID=1929756 RepID=A0AA39T2U9_ARMTA|nr:uncharacterized protein EV420DRAFT_1641151 [Desarmillaria tabescens]KAK0460601.1 hypothetical protein EV420DRAFT_1641151 [Desarmillaria tabescens]
MESSPPIIPSTAEVILSIPPEISADIFVWVDIMNERHRCFDTPWILSQVCGRWRDIALSFPQLWSRVHIMGRRERFSPGRLAQLQTALARARSYPLWIEYFETADPGAHMWTVILAHCAHWKTISLSFVTPEFPSRLPGNQHLPLLESFDFRFDRYMVRGCSIQENALDGFSTAPRLRQVSLYGIRSPSCLKLPWSQLTTIDLACGTDHDEMQILIKSSNLQRVLLLLDHEIGLPLPGPVVQSSLRSMETWDVSPLQYLTLPNLEVLSVVYTDNPSPIPTIHSFVSRSQCALRTLHLNGLEINEDLHKTLLDIPSIEDLRLEFSCTAPGSFEAFMRFLAYPKGSLSAVLPRLKDLHLVHHGFDDPLLDHTFVDMIRSRRCGLQPLLALLESIVCEHVIDGLEASDVSFLRKVEEEGLKLYVNASCDVDYGSCPW